MLTTAPTLSECPEARSPASLAAVPDRVGSELGGPVDPCMDRPPTDGGHVGGDRREAGPVLEALLGVAVHGVAQAGVCMAVEVRGEPG